MPSADELLNSLLSTAGVHEHPIVDSDTYFTINAITREVVNTARQKNVVMQYDHNSESFTFELPRYVENHDMTLCNRVRVHFDNIDGETGIDISDVAELAAPQTSPDNPDVVTVSWTITRQATQLAGNLSFLVQYMCVNDNDEVTYEWHSDMYSDIEVRAGKNNSEAAVIEYSNILEQWYQRLFGAGDSIVADIIELSTEQRTAIVEAGEAQHAAVTAEGVTQTNAVINAGVTQTNAVINAGAAQIAAVEAKGAETLETIPNDYTELYGMANDAVRTRANAIVENVEGNAIAAHDCSSDYLRGLRVFGKSEQFKTTGKQLLNNTGTTYTSNGITFNSNADGSISISGTATGEAYYLFDFRNDIPIRGTELIASITGSNDVSMVVGYFTDIDTFVNEIASVNSVVSDTLTYPEEAIATRTFLAVNTGKTVNATVYPLLRLATVQDDSYEPYTGGVASPSPEYPQEINSVENLELGVYGKNLITSFVDGTKTQNGVTFTVNGDGSITIDGTATEAALFNMVTLYETTPIVRPGAEFIISGATNVAAIQVWEWQDKWVQRASTSGEREFSLSDAAKGVLIRYVVNPGLTADNLTVYPMLRLASDADSTYEQAKTVQTVTIPHTLPGIPVSSGGNYTDANEQQWICDEVDLARGVYVQRIGCTDLTEADWTQNSSGKYFSGKNRGVYSSAYRVLCTHINGGTSSDGNKENVIFINANNDIRLNITLDNNTVETVTSAMNGAILIGVLAMPIETALTDAEIVAFKALRSNYPNTTVLNDAGAWMEVAYNADTELYFNNSRGATDEQVEKSVDAWLTAHFTDAEEVAF